MDKDALVKTETQAIGHRRSLWRWYKDRPPALLIAIPFGLAIACLTGAWTVLNEGEYAVALALVALFLLFGIQATRETVWPRKSKWTVSFALVVMALYSGAVVVKKAAGKPWSNLLTKHEETARVVPQPIISPVETPTPEARISPSPSVMAKPSIVPSPSASRLAVPPLPEAILSPVASPSPAPSGRKFNSFIGQYQLLHKGYKVYGVIAAADNRPSEYYVRLGVLNREQIRLLVYVVDWYSVKEVMLNIIDNYDKIVEDLKALMRSEGTEFLGMEVSKTVVVYIDIEPHFIIEQPTGGKRNDITFYFERRIA